MKTGLTYTATTIVDNTNTAKTIGSGDLDVFATPAMVALMENAAMLCVASTLSEGDSTVGAKIESTHIKPSALGDTITATATLTEVDGRKLTFSIKAADSKATIGEATHIRYIINKAKFMAKL